LSIDPRKLPKKNVRLIFLYYFIQRYFDYFIIIFSRYFDYFIIILPFFGLTVVTV